MMERERVQIAKGPGPQRPERRDVVYQRGSIRGSKTWNRRVDEQTQLAAAHILIAEDDPEMRRFLVDSFEEEGYRVTEAENGHELRRRLARLGHVRGSSVPDILVSDIRLPGFSGLELLADLRESDWSLPVILITAFGDESVHREGKRLGAAMVLDKPFDIDDLLNAVRKLVPPR